MGYYLFFDTETTGKPLDWKRPMSDVDNWPRLVQLGVIVTDEHGNQIHSREWVIQPYGFEIPEEATKIHGITTQKAKTEGFYLGIVLAHFVSMLTVQGTTVVGHNIDFDINVMGAEYIRRGMENPFSFTRVIDTMKSSTDFCKIPSPYRMGGYKWPKLNELYEKLFGVPLAQSHTAMDDIQATAKCFFELKRLGVINLPEKEKI